MDKNDINFLSYSTTSLKANRNAELGLSDTQFLYKLILYLYFTLYHLEWPYISMSLDTNLENSMNKEFIMFSKVYLEKF